MAESVGINYLVRFCFDLPVVEADELGAVALEERADVDEYIRYVLATHRRERRMNYVWKARLDRTGEVSHK